MSSAEILAKYNEWRRGDDSSEMPDPTAIGIAIDSVLADNAALKEENERLSDGLSHHMNISQVLADGNANMYEMVMERDAEIALLKARVAELEAMHKPVYCVTAGIVDDCMNELYSHHDEPVPMADNFVLYRKEPTNDKAD